MYYGATTPTVHVSGWPGVFRQIKYKMPDSKYFASTTKRIDSVTGIISLYPNLKNRWLYKRNFGWCPLDLFFTSWTDDMIKAIMKQGEKRPLLFWGAITERHSSAKWEYEKFDCRFDIAGLCRDESSGRLSPHCAILLSSGAKELRK